jgi:hypothetical protein
MAAPMCVKVLVIAVVLLCSESAYVSNIASDSDQSMGFFAKITD